MKHILNYPCGGKSSRTASEVTIDNLVGSPFSLHDGEPIVLSVSQNHAGVFRVTDRALAADVLAMEGLDLSTPSLARSWKAIQTSVGEDFLGLGQLDEWEIVAYSTSDALDQAIHEVVAAVLRADGLSSLQRPRAVGKRLDHAVISAAKSAGLETLPNAPVQMRSGAKRNVTARVSSNGNVAKSALIQTFGPSRAGWEIPDRASGLFRELLERPEVAKISVLGASVRLDRYQRDALKAVSEIVVENELSDWMQDLAVTA